VPSFFIDRPVFAWQIEPRLPQAVVQQGGVPDPERESS